MLINKILSGVHKNLKPAALIKVLFHIVLYRKWLAKIHDNNVLAKSSVKTKNSIPIFANGLGLDL